MIPLIEDGCGSVALRKGVSVCSHKLIVKHMGTTFSCVCNISFWANTDRLSQSKSASFHFSCVVTALQTPAESACNVGFVSNIDCMAVLVSVV